MQAVYSALSRAGATQKYSFIASWISREVRWKKAGVPAEFKVPAVGMPMVAEVAVAPFSFGLLNWGD